MKRKNGLMLLPLWLWTVLFVLFPMGYVLVLSFVSGDAFGIEYVFTMENYKRLFSGDILTTLLESLRMSLITTAFTLLCAYPFAYFMSLCKKRTRAVMLMLIIVPFWTSALMRMFGWRIIFQNKGLLNAALEALHNFFYGMLSKIGLYAPDEIPRFQRLRLMYTEGLVVFGMIYTMLPFMVLPVYSSIEKQSASLKEAARDLGANPLVTFFTVTLPLSLPGVISGITLVFVPSLGLFFINKLLGGGKTNYLGDLIDFYLKDGRDWALSAALSMIVLVLTFLSMGVYRRFSDGGSVGVF